MRSIRSYKNIYFLVLLFLSSNVISDQIPGLIVGWYDYGYSPGKLTMAPTGNGRIADWHRVWPGHSDMYTSPSSCSSHGQKMALICPRSGCSGGFTCRAETVCPAGAVNLNNGFCEVSYSISYFPESVSPSCSAGIPTAGNPISIADGSKLQSEIHVPAKQYGGVSLDWTYRHSSGLGRWKHFYGKYLSLLSDFDSRYPAPIRSAAFSTASGACTSGWAAIKSKINNSIISSGAVEFSSGRCLVKLNGKIVKELPIQSSLLKTFENNPEYIQVADHLGGVTVYRGLSLQNTYQDINGSKNILVRELNRWKLNYADGKVEHYDVNGRLTKIIESGVEQQLTYDQGNGNLLEVVDNKGHKLSFAYSDSKISSVTLDNTKTTSYTYTTNGMIERVTHPDNTFRIYHYEDSRFPTALTGITDERNVRYATWAYDAQGRAISSEHAGGAEKTLLSFNADGSTTVTNSLGKQTIYRFDYINGAKRVVKVEGQATTNCLAANKDYTYTPEGWIQSKTDWKGIKTVYSYNSLGQEISRTEAFGTTEARTITTEWHPEHYLKTKITEPEREITFVYDDKGRLLNQKTRSLITQ